jgi:hypothetical protein
MSVYPDIATPMLEVIRSPHIIRTVVHRDDEAGTRGRWHRRSHDARTGEKGDPKQDDE